MSYQFKIILQGIEPIIWRRIIIPLDASLGILSDAIIDSMQWFGICYYRFIIEDQILFPDYLADEDLFNCENVFVKDIISYNIKFEYGIDDDNVGYDEVGNGWMHDLIYEGVNNTYVSLNTIAKCLDGENACPPEDCGFINGYKKFLSIVIDKNHPDRVNELHYNFKKDDFNPSLFDKESVNFVRRMPF